MNIYFKALFLNPRNSAVSKANALPLAISIGNFFSWKGRHRELSYLA